MDSLITEYLKSVDSKIDDIQKDISEIKADLRYHIKRTDLLEENMRGQDESLKEAILPIQWAKTTVKIILVAGAVAGAYAALTGTGIIK